MADSVVWKLTAEEALKNSDYNALVAEAGADLKFNEKVAKSING